MDRKLSLYAMADAANYNASTYYRIILPTWTMHKLGLPIEFSIDQMSAVLTPDKRVQNMTGCDFHLAYQSVSPYLLSMIQDSRTWPYQDFNGIKLGPPSFICDTDDDLFNVHPLNQAFGNLGHKDMDGNELLQGQKLWGRNPLTNEPILLWADGENISFEMNRTMLNTWRDIMKEAELVTVSGTGTKNMVIREMGEEHAHKVYVNPNCIDLTEYPKIDLADNPNEVKILYQGSDTHWEDLWAYKDSLSRVIKKYPHAKLIIWGISHKWFLDAMPVAQTDTMKWMDYRMYKLRLATLGHDICLAPLRDSVFNQCRSAIKWYEGAATWKPAACLAQNTGAFKEEVKDGETAMLFDTPEQFEERLCELIEDATKRKQIAANAKDWIKDNRDPSTHALKYFERLQEVRKARLEWPEPQVKKVKKDGLSKTKHAHIRKRKTKSVRKR